MDDFKPQRGDEIDQWVKRNRDEYQHGEIWIALDRLLDNYRLHADLGMPLSAEVDK